MNFIIGLAIIAVLSHRELRKFAYGISGLILIGTAIALTFNGSASILELSKVEILLVFLLYFLTQSNTTFDRSVNKDWFVSKYNDAGTGWLQSKYADLIWVGALPFFLMVALFLLFIVAKYTDQSIHLSSHSDVSLSEFPAAMINSTTICAVLLLYIVSVLALRNLYLRFQMHVVPKESVEKFHVSAKENEIPNE